MSLVLDDLLRDPDRLLQHLRRMTEVITQQNASLVSLQAKHDTILAERDAARTECQVVGTERDLIREEHEAAQAEVEKLLSTLSDGLFCSSVSCRGSLSDRA